MARQKVIISLLLTFMVCSASAEPEVPSALGLTIGKTHPLLVHFPIAILLLTAVLLLMERSGSEPRFQPAIRVMTAIAAATAVLSCLAGWLLADSGDYGDDTVDIHRWTAVVTAALAVAAWLVLHKGKSGLHRWLMLAAAVMVSVAAHFGALLTHGADYWLPGEPEARGMTDWSSLATGGEDALMDGNVRLRSILAHNCYSCHGPAKVKGGLRLDSEAGIMKGGEHGKVIVPGKPEESELIRRIRLPRGHKEAMPSKGAMLSSEEISFIESWIRAGAPWPKGDLKSIYRTAALAPRLPDMPAANGTHDQPVDRFVDAYFSSKDVQWPAIVADRIFIRRVYFDIIGLPPSADAIDVFIADQAPDKREKLVDQLLSRSEDYAQHWLTFWNDVLRNDYTGTGYITGGRSDITAWLYRSLTTNKSYHEMVRELVSPGEDSKGFIRGIQWRGVVNASQRTEMQAAQNVAQVFMGLNLKCAACHDSFISDWKLDDAYAFANIFADSLLEINRCDKPTGRYAGYRMLYPDLGAVNGDLSRPERLRQLADSLTAFRNGRLARTMVNRIWSRLMGRGMVEPVDAMDNEPWSQDLLDWLAWDFASNGYDIKHLLRTILISDAYQLPSVAISEPADLLGKDWIFQGMVRRRLSAEQFTDAVAVTIGPVFPDSLLAKKMLPTEFKFPVVRAGLVPNEPMLRALGRPGRETVVTDRGFSSGLIQALELTNGDRFASTIRRAASAGIHDFKTPMAFAEAMYRKTLGRYPTSEERKVMGNALGDRLTVDGAEDLLWSLALHPEFQLIY